MKKILLPTPDYPPARGGVARYLQAIKETFPKQVDILYWQKGLPTRKNIIKELNELALGYDEIWVSHILPVGTAALAVYIKKRVPYSIFLHGTDFDLARSSFVRRWLTRIILRYAKNIVANSRALAEEIEKFSGRQALVVYPTIPDVLIEAAKSITTSSQFLPSHPLRLPLGQGEGRRGALAKSNHTITLLTVARLVERKGHLKVLAALKHIPKVNYLIVGDGPMRSEIEVKIKELGLNRRVKIKTDISDDELPQIYRSADIFVMPTTKSKQDREGFGIVYLEAQLFGLPVIATKQPGVDEAVIDKGTGLLIPDHPEALELAIKRLAGDHELRKRMGNAGHEFVLAGFNRENQFKKLSVLL